MNIEEKILMAFETQPRVECEFLSALYEYNVALFSKLYGSA